MFIFDYICVNSFDKRNPNINEIVLKYLEADTMYESI